MKQRLDSQDLAQLPPKSLKKLQQWTINQNYAFDSDLYGYMFEPDDDGKRWLDAPYLSIGQMIEFLDEYYHSDWSIGDYDEGGYVFVQGVGETEDDMNVVWVKPELCDALWEVVKQVLAGQEEKLPDN